MLLIKLIIALLTVNVVHSAEMVAENDTKETIPTTEVFSRPILPVYKS